MKRLIVKMKDSTVNIPCEHIEVENGMVFAYDLYAEDGMLTNLCGVFDMGVIDAVYISGGDK